MPAVEEDEISAILMASIGSNSKSAEISPEDAAWVDSCLVSEPQMFDESWDNALKEALLETLIASMSIDQEPSEARVEETAEETTIETDDESVHVQVEEWAEPKGGIKDEHIHVQPEELAEPKGEIEDECIHVQPEELAERKGEIEERKGEIEDDDIFKVWELETWDGEENENELIKQLKKALSETKYSGPLQSAGIDELVAGIGDLSLEPPSQ